MVMKTEPEVALRCICFLGFLDDCPEVAVVFIVQEDAGRGVITALATEPGGAQVGRNSEVLVLGQTERAPLVGPRQRSHTLRILFGLSTPQEGQLLTVVLVGPLAEVITPGQQVAGLAVTLLGDSLQVLLLRPRDRQGRP